MPLQRSGPKGSRPRLLVFVVGETARAQNWGLNGYARETTPQLTQMGVINFSDMHSCGTNTEVSVPCMFSSFGGETTMKTRFAHTNPYCMFWSAPVLPPYGEITSQVARGGDGLEYQSLGNAQSSSFYALMVGVSMRFCLKTYQLRLAKIPVIV